MPSPKVRKNPSDSIITLVSASGQREIFTVPHITGEVLALIDRVADADGKLPLDQGDIALLLQRDRPSVSQSMQILQAAKIVELVQKQKRLTNGYGFTAAVWKLNRQRYQRPRGLTDFVHDLREKAGKSPANRVT